MLTHSHKGDSKKDLLVLGGLGFIGHRLAAKLSADFNVHVIDNALLGEHQQPDSLELSRRKNLLCELGVNLYNLDIFNLKGCSDLIEKLDLDTVIQLAGASSVKQSYQEHGFQNTVGITQSVLNTLETNTPTRFIYFSSSMVYGDFKTARVNEEHAKNPVDSYGVYKYASEVLVNGWCSERGVIGIVLRPTAVYGAFDIKKRVVSRLIEQAVSNGQITIFGDGSNALDFTYVDDVVNTAAAAVCAQSSNSFNVSYGNARSLNSLAALVQKVHPRSTITHQLTVNHPIAQRGTLNSEKAQRILGVETQYSLEEGLTRLFEIEQGVDTNCESLFMANNELIPFGQPDILSNEYPNIINVLQSGWLTTGPQNKLFETMFSTYLSTPKSVDALHSLTLNSCASALILAIKAANITGEVIVPAFTFSATANAVHLAGAIPRFVDIEANTLGICVEQLETAITEQTEAILVVHLAGVICDIRPMVELARKHNLLLIEDCAQALGAEYKGQKAGTFGDVACYSFFPTKMITTGEGGMLVTNNQQIFNTSKALANHGYGTTTQDRESNIKPWSRNQTHLGYNFRMSNIAAALGVSQMRRINDIVETRRSKSLYVINKLKKIEGITVFLYQDRKSVYQALNILVSNKIDRDTFTLKLREEGVMASVHYPETLPELDTFAPYSPNNEHFPVATDIANRIVTLPMFGSIKTKQLDRIASIVKQVASNFS